MPNYDFYISVGLTSFFFFPLPKSLKKRNLVKNCMRACYSLSLVYLFLFFFYSYISGKFWNFPHGCLAHFLHFLGWFCIFLFLFYFSFFSSYFLLLLFFFSLHFLTSPILSVFLSFSLQNERTNFIVSADNEVFSDCVFPIKVLL